MNKRISDHFRKADPLLYEWIKKVNLPTWSEPENIFENLCDAIVSQQLSEKAGATIFARFKSLFPQGHITSQKLLEIPDEKIRAAGSSWAKVHSLKDLAQKVISKDVHLEKLEKLNDEGVITELTKIKGIGRWTAEMFLIFSLGRENIFSHGDLGLKRAIQKIYGLKYEPTIKQVEKIIKKWDPYKTYGARVLWKTLALK